MRKIHSKMNGILRAAGVLAMAVTLLMACRNYPLDPGGFGSVFTSVSGNYNCRTGDSGCIAPDGGKSLGSKVGEACTTGFLGLVYTGDKGVRAAAESGGMTRIHSVDYSFMSILGGLYVKDCIIVTGE